MTNKNQCQNLKTRKVLNLVPRASFLNILICGLNLVVINYCFVLDVRASQIPKIEKIFISDDGGIIFETKNKKKILKSPIFNSNEINFKDLKIDTNILESFNKTQENFEILKTKKHEFKIYTQCINECEMVFNELLDGLAYKITVNKASLSKTRKEKHIHILKADKADSFFFSLSQEKSELENFIDSIDSKILDKILTRQDFKKNNFSKADSASLTYIGSELAKEGHQKESLDAFKKALELNPKNLNAALALAEISSNRKEKLQYYLQSINDNALFSIAEEWFTKAKESHDYNQNAKAMIAFQFAILKNPSNPYRRFRYGQILEESGFEYFEQASKRYLEAAILAKNYLKTNNETILRKATEALIKVLSKKGSSSKAIHYCNSYLSMGFKKFLDGRSIKGIIKEINSNKNPFKA